MLAKWRNCLRRSVSGPKKTSIVPVHTCRDVLSFEIGAIYGHRKFLAIFDPRHAQHLAFFLPTWPQLRNVFVNSSFESARRQNENLCRAIENLTTFACKHVANVQNRIVNVLYLCWFKYLLCVTIKFTCRIQGGKKFVVKWCPSEARHPCVI